jgi:triosephosphate isomerase (TIM)
MYKTVSETVAFIKELLPSIANSSSLPYLAVPFTVIYEASQATNNSKLVIGAQNMHAADEGAFTGEIAGKMLKEAGARFVILGHSERRRLFHETDQMINKKVKRALIDQLQPILCIGETLEEREAKRTEEVLEKQMSSCLEDLDAQKLVTLMLAYEPVWAIGTDKTATPEIAQAAHHFCREFVKAKWGEELAARIVIQYGGSVKAENAQALIDQPDIDGLLVGGASLSVDSFSRIVNLGKSS